MAWAAINRSLPPIGVPACSSWADVAVDCIGWRLEGQNYKAPKHRFNLRYEPCRSLLYSPKTQFGCNDDAGTNLRFANPTDVSSRTALLRVMNEIRYDIGIQQVTHQSSTGSGTGSEIGGKSSSSGARVASVANNPLALAGLRSKRAVSSKPSYLSTERTTTGGPFARSMYSTTRLSRASSKYFAGFKRNSL